MAKVLTLDSQLGFSSDCISTGRRRGVSLLSGRGGNPGSPGSLQWHCEQRDGDTCVEGYLFNSAVGIEVLALDLAISDTTLVGLRYRGTGVLGCWGVS